MEKMVGNTTIVLGLLSIFLVQPQACRDPIASHTLADDPNIVPYVTDLHTGFILPNVLALEESSQRLHTEALLLSTDAGNREQWLRVQDVWKETMVYVQRLELLQIATLGNSLRVVGGEDLRDELYSWPLTNLCRVDQITASETFAEETFFTDALVSVYGLDAVEYLLFASTETVCPMQVTPVSDGLWESLGEENILRNRAKYIAVLTEKIREQTSMLSVDWNDGFPFSLYQSNTEALQAIFTALFYMETMTKERKIAYPLGLDGCTLDCSEDIESKYAGISLENIRQNIEAFVQIFFGEYRSVTETREITIAEHSFASIVQARASTDIIETIRVKSIDVLVTLDTLEGSLAEEIAQHPENLEIVLEDLGVITNALKWDIAAIVELEIPSDAAGDND
jgi:predicted lipoprotein